MMAEVQCRDRQGSRLSLQIVPTKRALGCCARKDSESNSITLLPRRKVSDPRLVCSDRGSRTSISMSRALGASEGIDLR